VGEELFSDAAGAEGTPEGTYLGMVRHNVDAIAEGLG
jgi:manganese/zinc/iron transport system substrate-binding protein